VYHISEKGTTEKLLKKQIQQVTGQLSRGTYIKGIFCIKSGLQKGRVEETGWMYN
jgi:hypothetical protein